MFSQFFISHLEKQGVITSQQAVDALTLQKDTKVRIGTLAVEEGMLTPEQAEIINRQQATANAHFGELALQNGFLTQEQLDSLLDKQPRDYVILKQILHDMAYAPAEVVDAALSAFREELGFSDAEFERLLDNHVDTYISKVAGIDVKANPILTVFTRLFIKTAIRLVDKEIMVGKAVKLSGESVPYTISIKLKGDDTSAMVFSAGSIPGALEFAGKFAEGFMGITIEATVDIAWDAMKEFLNCVGGLFTTELTSKTHLKLDIEVPEYFDAYPVETETIALPFSLTTGGFKVFIH